MVKSFPKSLKEIHVPKRYITREASEFEDNICVTTETFIEMEKKNKFALKWHIYGLDYGVPSEIDDWLKNGHPVVVNVSRTIISEARRIYKNIRVIFIEVPIETIIQRIKDRKRETEEKLKERIERAKNHQILSDADFMVNNSGKLEDAIEQFLNIIMMEIKEKS